MVAKPSAARRWQTRSSWGLMPFPSWMTTTPGHGGAAAGVATKYGRAMSAMAHGRTAGPIRVGAADAPRS